MLRAIFAIHDLLNVLGCRIIVPATDKTLDDMDRVLGVSDILSLSRSTN